MDKYYFDEIMKLEPSEEDVGLLNSFRLMKRFADIDLINDENNNLYYEVNVDALLKSNIENEDLITLRSNGWELSDDNESLIKKL